MNTKPEETWMNDPLSLDAGVPTTSREDIAAAEEWRFIECRRCSEYDGDFVADLAADFARHRLTATPTPPILIPMPKTAKDLTAIIEQWLAQDCDWGDWERALDALCNTDNGEVA